MRLNDEFKIRVEICRKLKLYEPTCIGKHKSEISFKVNTQRYEYGFVEDDCYSMLLFRHFPYVLDTDGSLWVDANRYLLSKLSGVFPPNHRTLMSIASALKYFRIWLIEQNINWKNIPSRNGAKPTYKFCWYLHDEVDFGKLAVSTAKQRMSIVQGFYRWIISENGEFENYLWLERDINVTYKDRRGFQRNKPISSTDLTRSFKLPNTGDDYSEYIQDGGRLRPLPAKEQLALTAALMSVGNTEMTLSFLFALTTGARLQTVFTLRKFNFSSIPRKGATSVRVKVGRSTMVNTKYGKQMVILVPVWLYQRFRIYLMSERYQLRKKKSKHIYKTEDEQYVFLTRLGRPYYLATNDAFSSLYHSPPRGNSVTKFIRQQIKPELEKNGYGFDFRFHDLRATFGMNLLEEKVQDQKTPTTQYENRPDYFKKLLYVKQRMGHSSLKTTQRYLNFRENYNIAMYVQSKFELHLKNVMENAGE